MRIEGRDLVDLVLSWSLQEVLNVDLYKGQVLFYDFVFILCSYPFELTESSIKLNGIFL